MTQSSACPCGRPSNFSDCCAPFIAGTRSPQTAEDLMRSRYSAYVKSEIDYIKKTTHPSRQHEFDRAATAEWSKSAEWQGLKILRTEKGGPDDRSGIVEFEAHFVLRNEPQVHAERAVFERYGDRNHWYFVDGKSPSVAPLKRESPKVGRNDPCHCGSGQKLKRCHGA